MDLPLAQISGAVAGGVIGGFAGFISSNIQRWQQMRMMRRNVASALIGEISALRHRIATEYLVELRLELEVFKAEGRYPTHEFRGEREYAPIFRSLGHQIGYLSAPLPQDLAAWYTGLAVYQERAHQLYELAWSRNPDLMPYAIRVAESQYQGFTELVDLASPLLERLSRC